MRRIAILGEIGSGNLGDDFGYLLLRDALSAAFRELDILTDIRPLTPNLFNLLGGYHWDAVVTGVGTLLDLAGGVYMRALWDCAQRTPIAILGSGVSDVRHIAPTREGRGVWQDVVSKAKHVWVRKVPEGEDPVLQAPDPMWLHGWHGESDDRPGAGINVGYAGWSLLQLDPGYLNKLRELRSSKFAGNTMLLAAWESDDAWLRRVSLRPEKIYRIDGTKTSLQYLNALRSVLCTRIHLGVLAACHGAHPILPDYASKVQGVFNGTEVKHTVLPVDAPMDEMLKALVEARDFPKEKPAVEKAQKTCQLRVQAAAKALKDAW